MVAGGQFRDNPAITGMDGYLAIEAMRKQAAVCVEYSHPGLIATGLYAQNLHIALRRKNQS
jgi:hypothetical protein